jgi:predicted Zn finger-like uncharacterized protein
VQAQCPNPQCATRVQIPEDKVPDRPFKVRCPKCQTVISLPGRGEEIAAAEPAQADAPAARPEPAGAAPAPELPDAAALAHQERLAASNNDAIVALSGPAAAQLEQALGRLGFNVDKVDDIEEGARLLEQGVYELAVTSRATAAPGRPETLSQRMLRLAPDARRRVFVILVGDEFKSGDGTQAWVAQADLVLNPADAARAETLVRATIAERKRLYQAYADARRRLEAD